MRFLRAAAHGQTGFNNVAMIALAWVVKVIVSLVFLFLMVRTYDHVICGVSSNESLAMGPCNKPRVPGPRPVCCSDSCPLLAN
eukprot:scaffold21305_cov20-Tisochrysis_lutea.AAC.1